MDTLCVESRSGSQSVPFSSSEGEDRVVCGEDKAITEEKTWAVRV